MRLSTIHKEFGTLAGGNLVAQLITLAAYFALTRIYSVEDYGLYSIFYSYIEVLIIISTCKYELAIVPAPTDREAGAIERFALRLNAWVSIALLIVALVLWLAGGLPKGFAKLDWMVMLIAPMVFFCGRSRIFSFAFNRHHYYSRMALSETANSAAAALLKIGLGLLGMLQAGMPVGTVAARAIGNLAYRIDRRKTLLEQRIEPCEQHAAARANRNYPLYVATKDLMNTFSGNLPFLWLALHFSDAEVGLFALALTFTFRPMNILNTAFEQVLYARCAENVRERKSIQRLVTQFLLRINLVAIPVALVAGWIAEPLFGFCFGGRWSGCGVYVQALLPWVVVGLSSASLMSVSNIFSTQRTEFFFYLAMLVLRVAAIAVGIMQGSFLLAIRLYAAAGALVSASLLVWYLIQVRRYEITLR